MLSRVIILDDCPVELVILEALAVLVLIVPILLDRSVVRVIGSVLPGNSSVDLFSYFMDLPDSHIGLMLDHGAILPPTAHDGLHGRSLLVCERLGNRNAIHTQRP